MQTRILSASLAAVLLATAPLRADDRDAGVVLTTTGASLVVSAPITVLIGLAISAANPNDGGVMGPFAIGAFAGGCLGLGMLIPGIVLLATTKREYADDRVPTARKDPTFVLGVGPGVLPTPRAVVFPLMRASF
jgi:hypothetical protein